MRSHTRAPKENIRILPLFRYRLPNDLRLLPSPHQIGIGQSGTLRLPLHFREHIVVGLLDILVGSLPTGQINV